MTASVRTRVVAVALVATLGVLVTVGLAVQGLFERHVEREMLSELDADLRFLARQLAAGGDVTAALPDPRFQEPLSGLYWQARNAATGAVLRSPSLGGFSFPPGPDPARPGEWQRQVLPGPDGGKAILLERWIGDPPAGWRVAVAVDRRLLEAANRAFMLDLLPLLGLIGAGLLGAAGLQGLLVLRPIERVRQAVQDLRAGRRARIGGALPAELAGLAAAFDALLDAQREGTRRARERAADLAHGLRTPLALLGARARELRERGEAELAAGIDAVAASIDARMSRELARAHIRGPAPHAGAVALQPVVARVMRAFARLPGGDRLDWQADLPATLGLAIEEEDLVELLGVLLDNAGKWARSAVRVGAAAAAGGLHLTIDDDGPGIAPQDRRAALTRGVRLDPDRSGTGLGLSVAGDIAAAYGGTLQLEDSPLGGLRVRLDLPARAA